jgi:hypothetical protein
VLAGELDVIPDTVEDTLFELIVHGVAARPAPPGPEAWRACHQTSDGRVAARAGWEAGS